MPIGLSIILTGLYQLVEKRQLRLVQGEVIEGKAKRLTILTKQATTGGRAEFLKILDHVIAIRWSSKHDGSFAALEGAMDAGLFMWEAG